MIKDLNENTALKLKSLNEEEKKARGVLGRLYGPVASFASPTRNGRKYTQDLWEKLFESDLIKERFKNGGIFGQLCHPDYSEVDMEKIACVMPEPPVKDRKGNLIAYVDLIDTPCGRIAYQLAKYGYKFGISSRGEGDLIDGPDGEEVDPDTYQLNAFDLVEIPAVENARLSFVESLDTNKNKSLKQTLKESLDKASEEDKEIMKEALDNLGIDIDKEVNEAYSKWEDSDIELHKNTDWGARNYEDLPVPDDSFESDAYMYRADADPEKKSTKFIKYIRSNPIYPPYYAPEEKPFENSVGSMYDGRTHNNYDIHDRYEDQKTYDTLYESEKAIAGDEVALKAMDALKNAGYKAVIAAGSSGKGVAVSHTDFAYNNKNHYKDSAKASAAIKEIKSALKAAGFDFSATQQQKHGANGPEKSAVLIINNIKENNINEACNNESCENKEDKEVVNDKSEKDLVAEFQEALLKIKTLESDNLALQEKLSVCNAKEVELQEQLTKYKHATASLSESAKKSKQLSEEKSKLEENIEKQTKVTSRNKARISSLIESKKDLTEKLDKANADNAKLEDQLKSMNESLDTNKKQLDSTKQKLDKYRKNYSALKENFVKLKAEHLGLNIGEVKAKLGESYKLSDVDSICEELSEKKSKLNKLPFVINEDTNISFKKSKNEYIVANDADDVDDFVSDSLLHLANLK